MKVRFKVILVTFILSLALTIGAAGTPKAAQLAEAAQKLCADTLVALQATQSQPLAKLLSTQASSFLAPAGDNLIRATRKKLEQAEKWAEEPILSTQAQLKDIKVSDRMYAGDVSAKIEDQGKEYDLHGICVYEGGGFRWMMLAIVPSAATTAEEEQALKKEVEAAVDGWRVALSNGQIEQMLKAMAPDGFAVAVVGPDYGFYVFSQPAEIQMMLGGGQIPGPLVMEVTEGPEGAVASSLAAIRYKWKFSVAEFQDVPMEAWLHLYREPDGWRIAGVCGLPPVQ
jgi:ketosteroid isomerase-like protein